jgi:hypothetical protein
VGASCALRCYLQQPTGAGLPGAREVGTKYRNSKRQPHPLQEQNEGVKGAGGGSFCDARGCEETGVYETAPGKTRPSLRERWSQPQLNGPDTECETRE